LYPNVGAESKQYAASPMPHFRSPDCLDSALNMTTFRTKMVPLEVER